MMIEPDHYLPSPKRNGFWYIFGAFGLLGVIGAILVAVYRDAPKRSDVLERKRQKNATSVAYTIMFSRVAPEYQDTIVHSILARIGADTLITDMVIGSPVADPWSASVGEYERMIRKSMNETRSLPIGKQTQIMSMIAGLLTKNELPATIYLVGSLNDTSIANVMKRTYHTANGIKLRKEVMGPVRIVSMLTPSSSAIHRSYLNIFRQTGIDVEDFWQSASAMK